MTTMYEHELYHCSLIFILLYMCETIMNRCIQPMWQ